MMPRPRKRIPIPDRPQDVPGLAGVRKPAFVDPFAPLTPAQIQQQAAAAVQAQTAPLIQQIRDTLQARAAAGQQAITGYTTTLAHVLGGVAPQVGQAYDHAEQSQAAVNDALANRMQGAGSQLSSELAGKLAQINAPAPVTQQIAGGAAQTGVGAANAGYARGSSELSALLAHAAAAQDYTSKLPGFAALQGLQTSRGLQAQTNQELADKTGQITAGVPAAVAQLVQSLRSQELQKAVARQSGLLTQQRAAVDAAAKTAAIRQGAARVAISQQNADTAARRVGAAQFNADRQYKLALGRLGVQEGSLQLRAHQLDTKQRSGGFTPGQVQKFQGQAYTIADDSRHGYTVTNKDGTQTQVPPVSYQQALNRMLRSGVPPAIALAHLNSVYAPGELGRPYKDVPLTPAARKNANRYTGRH